MKTKEIKTLVNLSKKISDKMNFTDKSFVVLLNKETLTYSIHDTMSEYSMLHMTLCQSKIGHNVMLFVKFGSKDKLSKKLILKVLKLRQMSVDAMFGTVVAI